MGDSISITIEERKVEVTVLTPTLTQINLLAPVLGTAPTAENIGAVFAAADEKATPIGADSLGLSDSEDGDIIKKWTISNLLTFLVTAFDFLYQPLSTALSKITEDGGLPLWDGGAWPGGGGGGGEYEVLETRPMTGKIAEFFSVGADNNIKLELDGMVFSAGQIPTVALSIDGGATYPSNHEQIEVGNNLLNTTPSGSSRVSQNSWWMGPPTSSMDIHFRTLIINHVSSALKTYLKTHFGISKGATNTYQARGGGEFQLDGVVNMIKVAGHSGSPMDGGVITLSRRTY